MQLRKGKIEVKNITFMGETSALFGEGGGGIFICSCSARQISFEMNLKTTDFKRNLSGSTRIYEYSPPPPTNSSFAQNMAMVKTKCISEIRYQLANMILASSGMPLASYSVWNKEPNVSKVHLHAGHADSTKIRIQNVYNVLYQ